MSDKVFKTYNQQMRILRSRNLHVSSKAKQILKMENYYNIINGYKDLFLQSNNTAEKYKDNATFDEIYALYKFDRELRFIFLKRLLVIENNVKSILAYKISEKYGHTDYLKLNNFKKYKDEKGLQQIMKVISILQKNISEQSGKHNAITHYITKYGYVPFWVLVNVLTFGNISKLYGILKQQDQQSISKEFGINNKTFSSYLKLMSIFRNICAHEEIFYNKKLKTEIRGGEIHQKLNIPKNNNGKYIYGRNDVFALLICLKEFLPNKKEENFLKLQEKLKKLSKIFRKKYIA
ncbi:Abi family protein [Marinitoga lauensis]|uniref:Abi family protein n=1 Tax=Marinitoga lauensis TaxID=2201189 RepID=UPI0010115458|nr:Abi family protein [Marinitoga lauensis]